MKKTLIVLITILSLFIFSSIVILSRSLAPHNQARRDAYSHVAEFAKLNRPEDFYTYNGTEETYFTVVGQDENDAHVVAIVEQSTGNVDVYRQSEVVSEYDAVKNTVEAYPEVEVMQTRIGKEEDVPIWEVSFTKTDGSLGYYIQNFQTGEWIRTIENL